MREKYQFFLISLAAAVAASCCSSDALSPPPTKTCTGVFFFWCRSSSCLFGLYRLASFLVQSSHLACTPPSLCEVRRHSPSLATGDFLATRSPKRATRRNRLLCSSLCVCVCVYHFVRISALVHIRLTPHPNHPLWERNS